VLDVGLDVGVVLCRFRHFFVHPTAEPASVSDRAEKNDPGPVPECLLVNAGLIGE
jgi:hypothetical protein